MLRHTFMAVAVTLGVAATASAQEPTRLDLGGGFVANGEGERYLRLLQLVGKAPRYPVAIRPWTRQEAKRLQPTADHPWASRFAKDSGDADGLKTRLLRPVLGLTGNSAFPEGEGEGPVWLGRGLTAQATVGARLTWGMLDVQLAPMGFWAQNASFGLAPNGLSGADAFRDARYPRNIDAPQRFGSGSYGRIDPGYSRVAVEGRWLSGGISTMPLAWGPARDEPLVVGPGAGGFPHLFLATGEPLPIWIGAVHLKMLSGRIEQTAWSPVVAPDRSRFASGAVATFLPRGVPGLEIGFARFEHRIWTPGEVTASDVFRPVTGIFSDPKRNRNSFSGNGYASAFVRWAVAPAGFEVYGEYGREDYAGNVRWFLQKPDDLGNLLLGFQRVLGVSVTRMNVLRAELVNGELSSNERGQRGFEVPFPPYVHSGVNQGHTVRGQILGSPTAFGGAGWRVALDRYGRSGRTSWVLERRLLRDWLPVPVDPSGRAPEVRYTVRGERLRFATAAWGELAGSAGLTWALNQNTVRHHDGINLQATARWTPR
ncbi:MAG: hypothetical protein ACYC1S_12135 [Gemmatimonadaceae bacterium]